VIARTRVLALAALASLASCSSAAPPAPKTSKSAPPKTSAKADPKKNNAAPGGLVTFVKPSFLVPDFDHYSGVIQDDGSRRILSERMRLIAHDDGAIERAAELLPFGARSLELPSRLGGGYIFYANNGGGTQIWRSPTWLGKLEPLVQLGSVTTDIIPGFDRLYLRLQNNLHLSAIHPESGEIMGLGPLPLAAAYGQIVFADGWRGVIDTDLRGPLATFDAGMTWRPIDLPERPTDISLLQGDPAIRIGTGRYLLDVHGSLTYRADESPKDRSPQDDLSPTTKPQSPLGKRPLRAAIEDGYPDTAKTALIARGGALARISLQVGALLALAVSAYPVPLATCHALRLGSSFGFLCGEREGPTTVYELVPRADAKVMGKDKALPLPAMRPVLHFARPRFIAASGNGSLVIRGTCTDQALATPAAHAYCIRDATGKLREIRVKGGQGDLGSERVIALADGRIAILVPPRNESTGQLTLLTGNTAQSLALALPTSPRSVARELRRGMWLDGFEEREPGVLGGWVEAGGPVIGVRISLDGKVTAGELRNDAGGAILSGRFALSLGEVRAALESTAGGMTWSAFDLPERDVNLGEAERSRACGPVGCVLGGWIRIGWGEPRAADDLRPAKLPQSPYIPLKISPPLALRCDIGPSVTPPLPAQDKPSPKPPPRPSPSRYQPPRYGSSVPSVPAPARTNPTGWLPFRNTLAPTLASDEIGIDNGPYADIVQMRVYAWGKKGADWTRTGRWMIRFDDRFDPAGGIRSSALTTSLWADENLAAEAVGTPGSYGATSWGAFLDPSGRAALAMGCRSSTGGCVLYAAAEGQPVLPIRGAEGHPGFFPRPFPNGAVRVGGSWFFISQGPGADTVALYRVDLGVARQIATYYRPARYGLEAPRLVRRALGGAVGLLVSTLAEPGERYGTYYVLPIDPDTGVLGEQIPLGRRDFSSVGAERCAPGQDGWLFDTVLEPHAHLELAGGFGTFDVIEARVRMDPGSACIEGMSARSSEITASKKSAPAAKPAPRAAASENEQVIPVSATERVSGRRYLLRCHTKKR